MLSSCTGKEAVNHIEAESEKRRKPAIPARGRLEQTSDQRREKGKQAESRNWFTLVRCNKTMNRERSSTSDNESPSDALGRRAT